MLTQARLKELLRYDPEAGIFYWLERPGCRRFNTRFAGKVAGTPFEGYVKIVLDEEQHLAHRLAWLYVNGEWPARGLDHRDRVRSHNRLRNLREATHHQNAGNQSVRSNNTSGVVGVSWHVASGKWCARIAPYGKSIYLGVFTSMDEATAARNAAALRYFGEFASAA